MTVEQVCLFPARRDDRAPALCRSQLASSGGGKFGQAIRAEVGQRVSLQPRPQVLDRIELWRIGRQEGQLDCALSGIDVIAYQSTAVRSQSIPDDEQATLQMPAQRLEELDDLGAADCTVMESEQALAHAQAGDHRQLLPIEMELNYGRLASRRPGTHPSGPLRESGFVDEDNQSSFALGVFFRAGQVRRLQWAMAASSRSAARFSGFWLEKPNRPSSRQTCTSLNRTPKRFSMTWRTRLSVHRSVPNPELCAPFRSASRSSWYCSALSCAGRPPLLISRS